MAYIQFTEELLARLVYLTQVYYGTLSSRLARKEDYTVCSASDYATLQELYHYLAYLEQVDLTTDDLSLVQKVYERIVKLTGITYKEVTSTLTLPVAQTNGCSCGGDNLSAALAAVVVNMLLFKVATDDEQTFDVYSNQTVTFRGVGSITTFQTTPRTVNITGTFDGGLGTYLVSGGAVTYNGTGFIYDVAAADIMINYQPYTIPAMQVTLDASDPTHDRYDAIAFNDTSAIVITGTPSANPLYPFVDPTQYVTNQFILVEAATNASTASSQYLYRENTGVAGGEWDTTSNVAFVTVGSTSNPYAGTKNITYSKNPTGNLNAGAVTFTGSTPIAQANITDFRFQLYINHGAVPNRFTALFYNAAGGVIGSALMLSGQYWSNTSTGSWQEVVCPKTSWNMWGTDDIAKVVLTTLMNSYIVGENLYVDDVRFYNNAQTVVPPQPTELNIFRYVSTDLDDNEIEAQGSNDRLYFSCSDTPYFRTYGRQNTVIFDWTGPDIPTTFLQLTDTPASYVANKLVAVNSAGTALEFVDPASITDTYLTTASFNTSNGNLLLTRNDTIVVSTNLDGRYALQSHTHTLSDITDYVPMAFSVTGAAVGTETATVTHGDTLTITGTGPLATTATAATHTVDIYLDSTGEGAGRILVANGTGGVVWADQTASTDQNLFETIALVADSGFTWGAADVVADTPTDTLKFVAGSGIAIDSDATGDAIRIRATGTGGLTAAYATITDGTTNANATGGDTLRFRSSDSSLTVTVQNNDATYGDNVNLVVASVNWSLVNSTPTTLAGYGITNAYTQTQLQTSGQSSVHWNNITNKPTLDNYGSWNMQVDGGAADAITSGQNVNFVGGSNITLSYTAASNTLSIAATIPTVNRFASMSVTDTDSGFSWSSTGTFSATTTTDTVQYVSGSGINIDIDPTTKAIRIAATGSGGIANAYTTLSDGTNTATAVGSDTIRFRSSSSHLSIVVGNNDATFGDNVNLNLSNVPWSLVSSRPTTLAGYGITDAYTQTQLQTSGQSSVHWGNLTNVPTYDNYGSWTIGGDTGSEAVTSGMAVTIAGGSNVTTTYDTATNTLTVNATIGMTSFNITDSDGPLTAVSDGNTITYQNGTGITTTVDASRNVTSSMSFLSLSAFTAGTLATGDLLAVYDVTTNLHKRATISQLNLVLDHDALVNFVSNEHVDHTAVTITGTNSLTGGGNIAASRTLALVNDSASPGNTKYYGTNGSGTKGWYDFPVSAAETLTQTLQAGNVSGGYNIRSSNSYGIEWLSAASATIASLKSSGDSTLLFDGDFGVSLAFSFTQVDFFEVSSLSLYEGATTSSDALQFGVVNNKYVVSFYDHSLTATHRLSFNNVTGTITDMLPGTKDGTLGYYDEIGGNAVSTLVTSPGAGQDGYIVQWDNSNSYYTLTALPTVYYNTVKLDGVAATQRSVLNFIGNGVNIEDNALNSSSDIYINRTGVLREFTIHGSYFTVNSKKDFFSDSIGVIYASFDDNNTQHVVVPLPKQIDTSAQIDVELECVIVTTTGTNPSNLTEPRFQVSLGTLEKDTIFTSTFGTAVNGSQIVAENEIDYVFHLNYTNVGVGGTFNPADSLVIKCARKDVTVFPGTIGIIAVRIYYRESDTEVTSAF